MIFSVISASTLLSLALTAASIAYQRRKAKKLAAEMDKRKEVTVSYDGEPFYPYVAYGRCKLAGGKTLHRLNNSYTFAAATGITPREPETGANYSLDSPAFFIRETKITGYGVSDFTEFSIKTEIYWNGVKILESKNSSPLDQHIADGYLYHKGTKVDADSTVEPGGVGSVDYYTVYRRGESTAQSYNANLGVNRSGAKKEYLLVQQAVCFSGINRVIDIEVDDKLWNDDKLKHGQRIHFYQDGGVADPMATANGAPATNVFTNTAYASMVFRLNREEYNYNGSPNVAFYVEGMRIRDIVEEDGVYSLSEEKLYSNNPALILLDYLMSDRYGRGVDVSKIDLKTFYNAKVICNRVVRENIDIDGKVNGRRPDIENEDGSITSAPTLPPRSMPLYECNTVIDTERTIRENVELILESMPGSDLIWSGGIYKLSLAAPRNVDDLDALIVTDITEKDIVKDQIDLSWPDSSNRFNQVVVRFKNEFENFADDTMTWPTAYSAVYNQYLEEDSGKLLKTEIYLPAITDPYHALAKAEEIVRSSRNSMSVKLKVGKKGLLLEPGDIIRLTAQSVGLNEEEMKVESVAPSSNMTAELELTQFDLNNFAWNVDDDIAYLDKFIWYQAVPRPTNAHFYYPDESALYSDSSGRLTWSAPDDATISDYVVEASVDSGTTWYVLGTSQQEAFDLPGLNTGTYQFAIRARKAFTESSARAIASDPADELIIDFYIEGATSSGVIWTIYADTFNPATNNQSLVRRLSDKWFATYIASGVVSPTLPITSGITFLPLPERGPTLVFHDPYSHFADHPDDVVTAIAEEDYVNTLTDNGWYPMIGDTLSYYVPETRDTVLFTLTDFVADPETFTWLRVVVPEA